MGSLPLFLVEIDLTGGPWAESRTWTDITAWWKGGQIQRDNRESDVDNFSAGKATFVLNNSDRRFDPWNSRSPYYPNLKMNNCIRLRAYWQGNYYTIWQGYVDGWPLSWGMSTSEISVEATSARKLLSQVYPPNSLYEQRVINLAPTSWFKMSDAATPARTILDVVNNTTAVGLFESLHATPPDFQSEVGYYSGDTSGGITFHGYTSAGGYFWDNTTRSGVGGGPWSILLVFKHSTCANTQQGQAGPYKRVLYHGFVSGPRISIWDSSDANVGRILVEDPSGNSVAWSTVRVDDGKWHMVVVAYDGSGIADVTHGMKVYVDGVDVTNQVPGTPATWQTFSRWYVGIGGVNSAGWGPYQWMTMDGVLDEVVVFDGVQISSSQVAALWTAYTAPFYGLDTGAAIGVVLQEMCGVPASYLALETGNTLVGYMTDFGNSTAMDIIDNLTQTELGSFVVAADGRLRFRRRQSMVNSSTYTTVSAIFGAAHPNPLTAEQASLQTGTTGWQAVAACTLARDTTTVYLGAASLKITATGNGPSVSMQLPGPSVAPGSQVYARVYMQGPPKSAQLQWLIYDSANNLLSTVSVSKALSASGWTEISGWATMPSSAAYILLGVSVPSGVSGDVYYCSAFQVSLGLEAPNYWSDGVGASAANELPYADVLIVGADDQRLINDAQVQPNQGVLREYKDATSVAKYGQYTWQGSESYYQDLDNEALYAAQWVVVNHKDPAPWVKQVVIEPQSNDALWAALFNLGLERRVQVRARPPGGGIIDLQGQVQAIEWVFGTGRRVQVTLTCTPPVAGPFLVLDDTSSGVLDTGRLGY